MPLYRTNVKKFVSITNIIYNNLFNIKCNSFEIPNAPLSRLNRSDFTSLAINSNVNNTLQYYDDLVSRFGHIFENISPNLKYHIKDKVVFENGFNNMNITKLVRSFDIQGQAIFLALTQNNDEYIKLWNNTYTNEKTKYFDYVGIFGLKCRLPTDNYHYDIDTVINVRRYVDRSGIEGIKRVLELFEKEIKNPEVTYTETMYIPHVPAPESENNLIIPQVLPEKQQYYFNHNVDGYQQECSFSMDTSDKFKEYRKFYNDNKENKKFNLTEYFKYVKRTNYENYDYTPTIDDYILTPYCTTTLENTSIASCIIFGEDNIRFCDVEKLMSFVRFQSSHYAYCVDNFGIETHDEHKLFLRSDSEELNKNNFIQYNTFLDAVKWTVQVMNHLNPKDINHHNYKVLVDYCEKYDHYEEQMVHSLLWKEERRIEDLTFE